MTAQARKLFSRIVLPRLDEGYRLARWLTGNAVDAEDVVQEACLRAFTGIESFTEGNARAWFLAIVRNTTYSWLQRNRPANLVSSETLDEDDWTKLVAGGAFAALPPTAEELLVVKDEAERLKKTIEALPVRLKEVLVLREYHELSYREIAEISAIPIGTVMSRLARARRMLATELSEASDGA